MSEQFTHETVLLDEAVEALVSDKSGVYVDGTFGRGGHSARILEQLENGAFLMGIDKDLVAVDEAHRRFSGDDRFVMKHGSFAEIDELLSQHNHSRVDGILVDLGVSSPQLDEAERGFSFMNDGPLDMRMDTSKGESAADWLAEVEFNELVSVLREYGEERFAKRIASKIIEERQLEPIQTTKRLASIVSEANPSWEKHKHPATRVFQAIRIKVNNELGDLEVFLEKSARLLAKGGRLVVISFHSLEDRMVKRFMKKMAKGDEPPPGVPVLDNEIARPFKTISKAVKASKEEVARNPRARSAVMRILERVSDD